MIDVSYLRLIRPNMQNLAETVASVLGVEVAVADRNLTRLVGTGKFYDKLDKNCSDDSLFARVIKSGDHIINLEHSEICESCSNKDECTEFANMSYPISNKGEVVGVVSFASFDPKQAEVIKLRKQEYFNMLKETSWIIEQELSNIQLKNQMQRDLTEVNEIINCLNKGIIILDSKKDIVHINSKAVEVLKLDLSEEKIIRKNIENFIKGIKYEETNKDKIDVWRIRDKNIRVIYNINKLSIRDKESSVMISFDFMDNIINLANNYKEDEQIRFENIIGESDVLLKGIEKSKMAAKTESTILILGDSGTGKELFAKSIHNESNRKNGPFVVINCGSIPENLIESELFGYEEGAFTGASLRGKKGKIELANNGTLFLDEIGDLPLHLQTRLLRVLQERKLDRLGGDRPIDINVRVISATNKDLVQLIKEGEFRLDLYYRLNVIPIDLPPLKERGEDVFLCSDYIIDRICSQMNIRKKELSEEVKDKFLNYNWYGNVRELENILEHGICFSQGEKIQLQDLPNYFLDGDLDILKAREEDIRVDKKIDGSKSLAELLEEHEREIISNLLEINGDDAEGKKETAEILGISLPTLYRKIR